MPYTNTGKTLMLNALKGTNPTAPITHSSLHTAAPGESGTNEVAGGSPAYARKVISFAAPAGTPPTMSASGTVTFDVPAGTTVNYVGFFSAVTAGVFQAYDDVTAETFGGQGTYTVNTAVLDLNS